MDYIAQINSAGNNLVYVIMLVSPVLLSFFSGGGGGWGLLPGQSPHNSCSIFMHALMKRRAISVKLQLSAVQPDKGTRATKACKIDSSWNSEMQLQSEGFPQDLLHFSRINSATD